MSAYATCSYPELVDALERVSALNEFELEQEDLVDAMLTERQEILDAMAKLDARELSDDVRAELARRIESVLVISDEQISYIGRIREQIREELDGMVTSRAAVRAYRPAQAELPSTRLSAL